MANGVDPNEIHRKFIRILKELYVQNHHQLGLKGTVTVPNKKRPLDPQNSTDRKQIEDIAQRQTHDTFVEKGRMTHREEPRAQRAESGALEHCAQAFRQN